jgi:DNA-binding NarL/FixJ family response regulator
MECTTTEESFRPVRVVIVDDHDLARDGLRSILAREEGLEVVGEAADGREAIELCNRLRPDLVLMDVRMPTMDGLLATQQIKQESPTTSVIIITMYENPDYLIHALRVGGSGYILKGATRHEIVATVRQVCRGESPLKPELAAQLLRRLASTVTPRQTPLIEPLTPREYEVLRLLAEGKTNGEMAYILGISLSTVKFHIENIIGKLGASDRTQAAVRAIELGLLTFPAQ